MTTVRFIGDLPLWAGALLALLVSLGVWRYYRRESHDLPGRLRWVLPLLRSAACFLAVMILTGPVLHHRQVIGEPGRVLFFLDASQSMGAADRHMPVARKLAIAQGWLPTGQVDMSLWEMADSLAQARNGVAQLKDQPVNAAALDRCRQSFARETGAISDRLGSFPWTQLASAGETPAWQDIQQKFQSEVVEPAQKLLDEPIEQAASQEAVTKRLFKLSEAAGRFEQAVLAAFDAYGSQLAASGSESVASALAIFDQKSRWRRAENRLLDADLGILARLSRNHELAVFGASSLGVERLWDRRRADKPPAEFGVEPVCPVSDVGSGISGEAGKSAGGQKVKSQTDTGGRTAVVLMTDGRHNFGPSPLETARLLGGQQIPIYTVGFGDTREPPDLALLDVEHPELVFQKDRIRGAVVVKDQMPPGLPFVAQIQHGGEVLWQERLSTQNVSPRRIEFEFSVDELVERLGTRLEGDVRHYALPLALTASIAPLNGETDASNNDRTMRFSAIMRNNKLLLIDGRARWETRYLRNAFERDEQWHIDTILVGPGTDQESLPRGEGAGRFPADEAALFDYDLVIFGEIAPGVLAEQEQLLLRDFVERRGGGIIFIDGLRGYQRQLESGSLGPILPVSWLPGKLDLPATHLQLTPLGAGQSALMLKLTSAANESFWKELPPPHRIIPVEALPGTEVLAEALVDGKAYPVMVARSFGAGRVLYCAFDETWRWRYREADTYHQRFWNQVVRWIIEKPFAVSDSYVSLDSGPPSYQQGETAEIRVRLRGVDGRPLSDAAVDALLWRDGQVAATITLAPEGNGSGMYRGRTSPLAEGQYEVSVRAAGFSSDALKARTSFVVLAPESGELQQIACNDDLLRQMAAASGGQFLREEEIDRLPELLSPLSTGQIVESDTLLWQSPWWFAAIIALLAVEWTLRKRAGLL